jgi:hypothetical protein
MILSREEKPSRPMEIDLSGPDGNVFALMGYAKQLARKLDIQVELACDLLSELGVEKAPQNAGEYIVQQMMESDYENALQVFDRFFGKYVILYR